MPSSEASAADTWWEEQYQEFRKKTENRWQTPSPRPQVHPETAEKLQKLTQKVWNLWADINENMEKYESTKDMKWVHDIDRILAQAPLIKVEFEKELPQYLLVLWPYTSRDAKPEDIGYKGYHTCFHQAQYAVLTKAKQIEEKVKVQFKNKMDANNIEYPYRETNTPEKTTEGSSSKDT
ncbi:hypothetical protein DM02DRAFT_633993 [Periconia macrospinosa]|uniref:Uncharacterized protein n=1 Tax=Periconia macrospinosa TaxID=97972 RepID=A0A2V1D7K8_9PLEO|nr:hypothetical protein DM02DRAFT_633993 [Periconia macrospinosa]